MVNKQCMNPQEGEEHHSTLERVANGPVSAEAQWVQRVVLEFRQTYAFLAVSLLCFLHQFRLEPHFGGALKWDHERKVHDEVDESPLSRLYIEQRTVSVGVSVGECREKRGKKNETCVQFSKRCNIGGGTALTPRRSSFDGKSDMVLKIRRYGSGGCLCCCRCCGQKIVL